MNTDDRRQHPRLSKRMTCAIAQAGGRASTGVVRDVSENGLFIQTGARPELDTVVEVVLPDPKGGSDLRFEAGVARHRHVRGELAAAVRSGLGLEILPPRKGIARRLLGGDEEPGYGALRTPAATRPSGAVESESAIRAYRFRMKRHDRPESRILTIRCESLSGARARALARMGRGWKIVRAERL